MSDQLLASLLSDLPPGMPQPDLRHTRLQYSRGLDYYRTRVAALGFSGLERVLDAGCGCGQWSLVLAGQNRRVDGLDRNPNLLWFARRARELLAANNLDFQQGDLHHLPYADASFDAVFCYSVLMVTREDQVFGELARVLRPGGRLYLCSDGPGWPLYKLLISGLRHGRLRSIAGAAKLALVTLYHHGLRRRYTLSSTFLTRRGVEKLCRLSGIRLDQYGPEGSINNPGRKRFQPLFGETFAGLPADFEILGTRLP